MKAGTLMAVGHAHGHLECARVQHVSDLWRILIIVLITITVPQHLGVSSVSISAVSLNKNPQQQQNHNAFGDAALSGYSQQQLLQQKQEAPHPQNNKLTLNTNKTTGESSGSEENPGTGTLSLAYGGFSIAGDYHHSRHQHQPTRSGDAASESSDAKKAEKLTRANGGGGGSSANSNNNNGGGGGGSRGGDTRVTSNQDVTTLALAVENSSSVAIANINSNWNNVYVLINNPHKDPEMEDRDGEEMEMNYSDMEPEDVEK